MARPDGPFQLDSLTIISPTLRCLSDTGVILRFDFKTNLVTLNSGSFSGDSVIFEYSTFSFAAYKPIFRFSRNLYDSVVRFADYPGQNAVIPEKREELFSTPGLQKSGAITRGVSLGNTQNGFVNSSLNLQLEGAITSKIRLTAVLSDQNVPFQPQGNTQQIRELDRIYIQLDHKQGQLQAGDVVLRNEPSQFLRFFKNIQGAQLRARWDSLQDAGETRVAAGVAKGKFASVVVAVKEGVQGPYRLRPPNNPDLLVVILANSERIYFDNRLLKRGFNQDYVIDYNTGEITLNNQLLITRFTRLRCDFEYAERNYSRTIFMAEHKEAIGQVEVGLSHYQEQDNPNRPLSFSLDSTSTTILRNAGDRPDLAILPTAQAVSTYQEGQLLYSQKDTIIDNIPVQFYQLANQGDSRLFQILFTDVGEGRGDYVFGQYLGNGKSYVYTGPGKGNFLPVRQAVLPNQRSMSRVFGIFRPGGGHALKVEGAISRFDKNRISKLDDGDNSGNAQFISYSWLPEKKRGKVKPEFEVSYTRLSKNFNAIDRFRVIEFERDWNAQSGDTLLADDHLAESIASLSKEDSWRLTYKGSIRKKGENVNGWQQSIGIQHKIGQFSFRHDGFLMSNQRLVQKADWIRLNSEIAFNRYTLVPGYQFQLDENQIRQRGSDSIIQSAMNFRSHTLFIRSKDTTRQIFNLSYSYREDATPREGLMGKSLFSHNFLFRAGTRLAENHRVDGSANFRQIKYAPFLNLKDEQILALRIDYQGSFWNDALRQEFTYTTNTGQEQKRTFQFIPINAIGEGTHQWVDYNGNGLQELDEFVEAQRPEDRRFIKIFTPTAEFITAYSNLLNYRLNLTAPVNWQSRGGILPVLARFSLLTSLTADQKTLSNKPSNKFLPSGFNLSDEVVSANRVLRNTVFWNRTQSNVGGEYSFLGSQQKTLLSNGFSLRSIEEHRLSVRKNLSNYLNLSLNAVRSFRSLKSDALVSQNYRISVLELGPEVSFQPSNSQRFSLSGVWSQRNNYQGEERANLLKIGLEYRYNQLNNRTLNAFFRLTKIENTGNLLSPASYEMLEGLLPGNNLTLTLNVQQKLTQGLQLLLTYEGRKSEGIKLIHLGKMQANLLF